MMTDREKEIRKAVEDIKAQNKYDIEPVKGMMADFDFLLSKIDALRKEKADQEEAYELLLCKQVEVDDREIVRLRTERDDYFRIIEERGVQITNLCAEAEKLKAERDALRDRVGKVIEERDSITRHSMNLQSELTRLREAFEAIILP